MKKAASIINNFIAWIASPLIAMCPLCTLTAAFIALGQLGFLFTLARILTPILVGLIAISIFSFYLGFRIHKNPLPLVLSAVGGSFVIYSNNVPLANILFQVFGILLLSISALIDLNIRFGRRRLEFKRK